MRMAMTLRTGTIFFSGAIREPRAKFGMVIVLVFLLMALFAPWISPYDPFDQDFSNALGPPSFEHPFGLDQYGRDIFSRVIHGSRTAIVAIIAADGLAVLVGGAWGLVAGYYGGIVDTICMRVIDVLLAFPYLLLALIIVAALGASLTNAIIAIGVIYVPQYARLMRGQVLTVKEADYVWAARTIGASSFRVMLQHVLPNSWSPVLVMATLQSGSVILEIAGLSFLGLGAQPPSPDWGALLSDGNAYFLTAWWIATFPGLTIFVVVVGLNLIGDTMRDQLDPRHGTRS